MSMLTITVRRTSVYEVEMPDGFDFDAASDSDTLEGQALTDAIFTAIGGDEVDGSTDYVGAWNQTGTQVY